MNINEAQEHFDSALRLAESANDQVMVNTLQGLIALTAALKRDSRDTASKLDDIERRVKSLN